PTTDKSSREDREQVGWDARGSRAESGKTRPATRPRGPLGPRARKERQISSRAPGLKPMNVTSRRRTWTIARAPLRCARARSTTRPVETHPRQEPRAALAERLI